MCNTYSVGILVITSVLVGWNEDSKNKCLTKYSTLKYEIGWGNLWKG